MPLYADEIREAASLLGYSGRDGILEFAAFLATGGHYGAAAEALAAPG